MRDILEESPDSSKLKKAKARIAKGNRVRALLSGQKSDGGFGVHPYQKWTGAHWRLVSLVELGIADESKKAKLATGQVLDWLWGASHRSSIRRIRGLTRRCASQEGNALGVCSRLGMAGDTRVRSLADSLITWQWPDGGWNCDKRATADESSFYETLAPLRGLIEYHKATGAAAPLRAANRAAEVFLRHRMFRSERTNEVIDSEWLKLHYPLYWHYDILQGLQVLSLLRPLDDRRVQEALDIIESKRKPDGLWWPESYYWHPPGRRKSNVEVVDWGRSGPSEMITLNALRVLKAAERLE